MAHLRLTTEPGLIAGCARVGAVSDDSIKDLRRKIVKAGGNAALLSFRVDDLSTIQAEVYRCTGAARAPFSIPPPPAGAPPPPPPVTSFAHLPPFSTMTPATRGNTAARST